MLPEPGIELRRLTSGGDVEIGIERGPSQLDRPLDALLRGSPRAAVDEDRGAPARYGSASRTSAASSSDPVRKYSVSSLV